MKYVMGLCEKKTSTAMPFRCSTHNKYARMISLIRWEEEVRGLNSNFAWSFIINLGIGFRNRNEDYFVTLFARVLVCDGKGIESSSPTSFSSACIIINVYNYVYMGQWWWWWFPYTNGPGVVVIVPAQLHRESHVSYIQSSASSSCGRGRGRRLTTLYLPQNPNR